MRSNIFLVGITTMLLLVFVLPAVLASEYTLEVFGNANGDDTINMQDVTYTELIILEYKDFTQLADARYDSEIDILDVTQIELIILGQEKELTLIDTAGRVVTVNKPLNRLVTLFLHPVETLRSLKVPVEEVIAGMGYTDNEFFPELSEVPTVGTAFQPDIEAILELQPDAVIVHARRDGGFGIFDEVQNACEAAGITVLCLNINQPDIYLIEVEKLGYMFDKRAQAEELCNFYDNIHNSIEEKVETVSEENRPKVYYESRNLYESVAGINSCIDFTGGIDIFPEGGPVDIEALIAQDPDVIVKVVSYSDREVGGYHLDAEDTAGMEAIRTQSALYYREGNMERCLN